MTPTKKIPAKLFELQYLVLSSTGIKNLGGNSAVWRAHFGVPGPSLLPLIRLVKEPPKMVFGGVLLRLWRRAQFSMLHCRGIIARLRFGVCDGVQEKCDEKRQALTRLPVPPLAASREKNFRCHEPAEHITLDNRESPHRKRTQTLDLHGHGEKPEMPVRERGEVRHMLDNGNFVS